MYDLSILIPSLIDRYELRDRLLHRLAHQTPELLDRCEVLVAIDNGQATIGEKRNNLLDAAQGEYVIFIDDDDIVTEDYLDKIFEGIDKGVDHVGVCMLYAPLGKPHSRVECSMHYAWTHDGEKYLRPPQHVCAIRRGIACQVGFPAVSFGEDKAFASAVAPIIETEHIITRPIYYYLYVENK